MKDTAASYAAATASNMASSKGFAMNCTPTGIPDAPRPAGTEMGARAAIVGRAREQGQRCRVFVHLGQWNRGEGQGRQQQGVIIGHEPCPGLDGLPLVFTQGHVFGGGNIGAGLDALAHMGAERQRLVKHGRAVVGEGFRRDQASVAVGQIGEIEGHRHRFQRHAEIAQHHLGFVEGCQTVIGRWPWGNPLPA